MSLLFARRAGAEVRSVPGPRVLASNGTPTPGSSGQVKSFWLANSGRGGSIFDAGMQMVPSKAQGAHVAADGTVLTSANWDENGGELHLLPGDGTLGYNLQDVHPNTGAAVTVDPATGKVFAADYGHALTGIRRFPRSRSGAEAQVSTPAKVLGLAVIGGTLYAACADNVMRTYSTSTLTAGATWAHATARRNGLAAVDGKLCLLTGSAPPSAGGVTVYSTGGSSLGTISGLTDPRGLGVDSRSSTERLVVCLGSGDHRLAVYDLGTLSLVDTFGVQGGVYSTVGAARGNALDKSRLVLPRAARIFPDGSWTVVCDANSLRDETDSAASGVIVRKLPSKTATAATWENLGLAFCDGGYIDPTTGVDAFTVNDWFKLDQSSGSWTHYAHTLDLDANPNDPRPAIAGDHGHVNCFIFYVSGQRFMATVGMYGEPLHLFRQSGETFVYTGQSIVPAATRGIQVLPDGTMFTTDSNNKVARRTCTGIDGSGNPVVSAATTWAVPAEWNGGSGGNDGNLKRALFDPASGALYVSGWATQFSPGGTHDMEKMVGNGLARYNNFLTAGFSQRAWMIALPSQDLGLSDAIRGLKFQIGLAQAGSYVFTAECAHMTIRAYSKATGALVKEWVPGSNPAVPFGDSSAFLGQFPSNVYRYGYAYPSQPGMGVLDSTIGLHAYQASNGVYVLTLYDNGAQKVAWMQWTP